jgi:glycosyltransferase involved in cell wall biosynthesis
MLISIIIPSFNQAQFLETTIRSVVEQGYPHKEIIVMDGGSTDGSVELIRKYESQLAIWRSEPDGGQASAIKKGFESANGEIIGWVNSDDLLAPGALQRVAQAAANGGGPGRVFHGGWEVIDAQNNVQEVYFGFRTIPWIVRAIGPAICQPGTFFGRDAYFRVGGLDGSLKYALDFDLWMKFIVNGVPFVSIPKIQGQFRNHTLQKGHSMTWLQHCIDEIELMGRRYHLAPDGTCRRLMARQMHRIITLATGSPHRTLGFRLFRRHRLRRFAVDYSQ